MQYFEVYVQVRMQATGQLLSASSQQCSDEKTAKQQAALVMVHQLQHAILTMFTTSQPELAITSQQAMEQKVQTAHLDVLYDGDHENSTPEVGHVVKMQYQLVLKDSQDGVANSTDTSDQPKTADSQPQASNSAAQAIDVQDASGKAMTPGKLLEYSSMFRFEYGGGGVISELQHAGGPSICYWIIMCVQGDMTMSTCNSFL